MPTDGENVLAQAQVVATLKHQLTLVAHTAQRLVAAGLEPRFYIVGCHVRAECPYIVHELVQLGNEHVCCKVAVHLFEAGQLGHTALSPV